MINTNPPQKAKWSLPDPPKRRLREVFREWLVTRHYSRATVECYVGWVLKFVLWAGRRDPKQMGATEVGAYLSWLANQRHVTAKTQNQALCALVRFYDGFLEQPLGDIGRFAAATRPSRLPAVLGVEEVRRLLACLRGSAGLCARLMYGCGLRVGEVVRLRVKDVDFARGVVMVRGGKGDKDRQVMLPESVRAELTAHLDRVRLHFESDGGWLVSLPGALRAKYPHAEREWCWQYVFPSRSPGPDPEDGGRLKRHHLADRAVQLAVKQGLGVAGITKRASCHTLRHSFATHLLESGTGIEDIKELLGHSRLETTMIYLHVAVPPQRRIRSPLDGAAAN